MTTLIVVVCRCRDLDLGRVADREEVGVWEGLLDMLVEGGACRHIRNVSRVGLASTTGMYADDAIVGVSDNRPAVPGAEKAPSLLL